MSRMERVSLLGFTRLAVPPLVGDRLDDIAVSIPCGVVVEVTLPTMLAPLLATKPTEAPVIAALVAVTVWSPALAPRVQTALSRPAAFVVLVFVVTVPPPSAVHVMATPATGRLAP